MLESVFIMIMAMGFVAFILAVYEESLIFTGVSTLMWIIVMAGFLAIEVPRDTYYQEWGLFAVALGFILINIVWSIKLFMDYKRQSYQNQYLP